MRTGTGDEVPVDERQESTCSTTSSLEPGYDGGIQPIWDRTMAVTAVAALLGSGTIIPASTPSSPATLLPAALPPAPHRSRFRRHGSTPLFLVPDRGLLRLGSSGGIRL